MGRTELANLDKHGQPQWHRGAESFLLPLPQVIVAREGAENLDMPSFPMINAAAEDSELRLEVWSQGPLATSGHCLGQVLLEGSDLLRQCYKDDDKRAKRTTAFRLAPCKPTTAFSKLISDRSTKKIVPEVQLSLKVMLFLLHPQDGSINKSIKSSKENSCKEHVSINGPHKVILTEQIARAPIEAELGGILTRIERNAADERRDGIARLAELALSDADGITDIFLSQGAAPVLVNLLTDRSTPTDRRDGAAAVRGLFRNGNIESRRKLISAGVLPHLLRLVATADPSLGDASHEGFCALAELLDRGESPKEFKMLAEDIDKNASHSSTTSADRNSYAKHSSDIPGDSLKVPLMRNDVNDDLERGLIPDAIVEEIFSTCGRDTLMQGLVRGATRTKPSAARVIAALAGTPKGAAALIGESSDVQVAFVGGGGGGTVDPLCGSVMKVLLDVANSGPNQAAAVKSDSLRGLFRLMGGTEHPIQGRCAMIEKAGGRAVFGKFNLYSTHNFK